MYYNDDIKIGELLNNENALTILTKHLPEFVQDPLFKMASTFTLDQLGALPQVDIPANTLQAIKSDLSKLSFENKSVIEKKTSSNSVPALKSHEGKVIIVTGAGSGIGRASSMELAARGAQVVMVDYNEESGQETLDLVKSHGGEGIFVQADVSKSEDVQKYIQKTLDAYGKIDVLFNNAGIMPRFQRFQDITEEDFDRVVDVNLKGIFLGMKFALQVMDKQGYGHIINTASTTAIRAEHSTAAYTASKHGVAGLTKAAAIDYVRKGIRVNAICPGGVATSMTAAVPQQLQESGYMPEEFPIMRMGRYAEPEELAKVVVFLASDDSSYMTGSLILADGGLTL